MNTLLTGASGFVGTHTAELLAEKRIPFVGICRTRNRQYKKSDIKKPLNISGKFSGVIHLAAKEFLGNRETPSEYFSNNFLGTGNVLDFCRKKDIPRIIFSSTMSVYGKKFSGKINEDTETNPESAYTVSKKLAEDAIINYSCKYGISYAILRYSTVFGPGQRKESKLAEIADKCLANKQIFFPKDSVRNFIFVKDVATANLLALKSKKSLVLNIAGKENVSFSKAAEIIKKVLKSESKIKIGKKSNAKFKISTELARKTIGFTPRFPFQEGIKQTLLCRSNYNFHNVVVLEFMV